MKHHALRLLALAGLVAASTTVASLSAPADTAAYSLIGGNLSLSQRDFRVFNNFTDSTANNNTVTQASFPGQTGAVMAIWKGHVEWASEPYAGTGAGDGLTSNPVLGSGGANFDNTFQGTHTATGGVNGNVHSELLTSSGSTLAYTETPISDGWRIRYISSWTWHDGPGSVTSGIDMQGVACHEIGHSLGLGHTSTSGATMTAFISGTGTAQRSIETDDANGVKAVYGTKSSTKPHIGGLSGSKSPGGTLTITGSGFSTTGNDVWFTRQGNLGEPQKVTGVASSSGGTVINVVIPSTATDGEVLVKNAAGSSHANLSNAWPIDIGSAATLSEGFTELHPGLADATGAVPYLTGAGDLTPGAGGFFLEVDALQPAATGLLLVSLAQGAQPFKGGTLYASPVAGQFGFGTDGEGQLVLDTALPAGVASGTTFVLQAWFVSPAGPQGAVASNGLRLDVP
jgi:hypothetical protein